MPYETGKKARVKSEVFAAIDKLPVKPLSGTPKTDAGFAKELSRAYPDMHMHGTGKYGDLSKK